MDSIVKKDVLLNGQQLVEHNRKLEAFEVLGRGNKEEDNALETAEGRRTVNTLESLYKLLKLERVYLANKRSKGVFEKDQNRVKITSVVGKLVNFGYMKDNQMYMRPHEALLLMEMNRLEVLYETVTMSIEQAYAIFFSTKSEVSLEEYIVYSYLSRVGYIIMTHDPNYDKEKYTLLEKKRKVNKEDEMIWCVLMEKLSLPHSRNVIESNLELYEETKSSMEKSNAAISGISEESSSEPPHKKQKIEKNKQENTFLDILKTELEYMSYKDIFDKFSYIQRSNYTQPDYEQIKELSFTFDLFLPKAHFKRTEQLANYRVIVIRSSEKFPTNKQLQNLYDKQCYKVPIVIAIVSDSFTPHFSICTF